MYPVLFSIPPVTIPTFGIFAFLGFFLGTFVIWKRGRETSLSEEEIFDAVILVTLFGLVGARVFFILFNFGRFGLAPLGWLSFLRIPGMTFAGGLFAGIAVLAGLARRKHWDFFEVSDIFVTGSALAQAIGWLGAFFSGTGVGRESRLFGLPFPGYETSRIPAQFVWMVGFSLVFIFLWRVEARYRTFEWYRARKVSASSGFLTFSYLLSLGMLSLLVSLFFGTRVYWWWLPVDLLFGAGLSLGGGVGLYLRSGRDFRQDREAVGDLFKKGIFGILAGASGFGRKAEKFVSKAKKIGKTP